MIRFQDMPTELMLSIYAHLGIDDIMELSSLCRTLYRMTQIHLGDEFSITLADYSTGLPPDELRHTTKTITFFTTVCRFRSLALRTRRITAHVLAEQLRWRHLQLPPECKPAVSTIPFSSPDSQELTTSILDNHRRHTSLLLVLFLCRNLTSLSIRAEISLQFIQDLPNIVRSYRPHPELRNLHVEWVRQRGNADYLQGYDLQDVRLLLCATKLQTATFVNLHQSSAMSWSPETRFLRGPKRKPEDDESVKRSWAAISDLSFKRCLLPAVWPTMLSPSCLGVALTHLEFVIPLRNSPGGLPDARMLNLEPFSEALNRISSTLEVLKIDIDLPFPLLPTMLGAVIHAKWDFLELSPINKLRKLVLPWFWWTSTSGRRPRKYIGKSCIGWLPTSVPELVLLKCDIEDEDVLLQTVLGNLIRQRQNRQSLYPGSTQPAQRIVLEFNTKDHISSYWVDDVDDLVGQGKLVGIHIELVGQDKLAGLDIELGAQALG